MKVIVVGAGIIGASIAYQLARLGLEVTVIDNGQASATAASFGWINASFYLDEDHHALRVAGLDAYDRLMADHPDLPYEKCGALWWEAQGAQLAAMKSALSDLGYPVEVLTRSNARSREPDVAAIPQEVLAFPREGAAESSHLARALLATAQAIGALFV